MASRDATVRLDVTRPGNEAEKGFRAIADASRKASEGVKGMTEKVKDMTAPARNATKILGDLFEASQKRAKETTGRVNELKQAIEQLGLKTKDVTAMARQLGREFGLTAAQVKAAAGEMGGGGLDRRWSKGFWKSTGLGRMGMVAIPFMAARSLSANVHQTFATPVDEQVIGGVQQDMSRSDFEERMRIGLSQTIGDLPGFSILSQALTAGSRRRLNASNQRLTAFQGRMHERTGIAAIRAQNMAANYAARQPLLDLDERLELGARFGGLAGAEAHDQLMAGQRMQAILRGDFTREGGQLERVVNIGALRGELGYRGSFGAAERATIAAQIGRQEGDIAHHRGELANLDAPGVGDPSGGVRRLDLLHRIEDGQRRILELQQREADIVRQGNAAYRERLVQGRQQADQIADMNRAMAQQEAERVRGLRSSFGLLDETERGAVLAASRRFAPGQAIDQSQIGGEDLEVMLRHRGLFGRQLDEIGGQRGEMSGFAEILQRLGLEENQRRYEQRAREAEQLKVELDTRIAAELRVNEPDLARHIAEQLSPQIRIVITALEQRLNQEMGRQLNAALTNREAMAGR